MDKSESITALASALIKFQGKMVKVTKDSTNPHFKNRYASLSAIIEATTKPLSECGLAIIQLPAGKNQLTTTLLHESGEYISETYEMNPSKNDPQGIGSAITYQRRYAMGAILNLNIDEDDDGNEASKPAPARKQEPKEVIKTVITEDQFKRTLNRIIAGDNEAFFKAQLYFDMQPDQFAELQKAENQRVIKANK